MTAWDRRRFLAGLPGGALALGGLPRSLTASMAEMSRAMDVGVQLYTVRTLMQEEPDRTLEAVAAIGYREVELAGLYGMTPEAFRGRLDAVGLRAASSHHSVVDVRQRWREVVEGAVALGQRYVVVPSIPAAERTPESLRRIADDFNRAGETAREAGLRFGYHNHDWEFGLLPDGSLPMSVLLDACDPGLVDWQMDVFWTVQGGHEPSTWLDAHAGRVTTVHVKDRTPGGEMVDVGQGTIDYRALLRRARELGLEHLFVEHDWPDDPLRSVRRSFDHLVGIVP